MELYRGYVPTKNKKCTMKFGNGEELMTYDQVKDLPEYAGILGDDTVLIDIDDCDHDGVLKFGVNTADLLMDIVEDLQLNCRVYQSNRGRHFLFKNDGRVKNCATDNAKTPCILACGLHCDIKVGSKNSYEVLKYKGEERFIEWDIEEGSDYDVIPKWLLRINTRTDFIGLQDGDGRNDALWKYILTLQREGFSKDEIIECITIINKYIFKSPMSENELNTILRDDAFNKPCFFDKTTFLFDKFATYLVNNNHIAKINNQLHIYKDGIYVNGYKEIETIMITLIPNLKDTQRKEVLKYLELIAPVKKPSDANYIAFNNGIYDLVYDSLEPYRSDLVITNKIPWDYVKGAYNELADKTLNKMACNDSDVRAVLEECIGYCFYRRNELGKSFILTGEKSNGKSTYLDVISKILGEENISALDLKELGDRFSTSMMFGKCANIGDDIGDEFLQGNAVATFKKIVTGNRIKAERKGQDPFEFNPYIKLLFSANDMPRMKDKTGAVLRRLVMIPFNARFTKDDPDYDPYIRYKLIEQQSIEYFIQIGIQGLKRVIENYEFTQSEQVTGALKEYEIENNPILAFIDDIDIDEVENEVTSNVYLKYDLFCAQNKFQAVSNISFSKMICKQLGLKVTDKYDTAKKKKVRVFVKNEQ